MESKYTHSPAVTTQQSSKNYAHEDRQTDTHMSLQTYHHTTFLAGIPTSVFWGIRIYYFS